MTTPRRVLVFQHASVEHPGIFRDFLAAEGHGLEVVELDAGDPIPPLSGHDALWVMGGPMDVWQEEIHPWLRAEKAAIREAVETRRMPYLGFCLGHQLLGEAMGGTVGKARYPEVGIHTVRQCSAGDPFLAGLPAEFEVLQWHGAEVQTLPPGGRAVAESAACAVQAMRYGNHAFSMQFHIEITASAVADWNALPEYAATLREALGEAGARELDRRTLEALPIFNARARRIYENWKRLSGFAP